MGKSGTVRQDCEREEGQPPATRSRLETAQRAARAERVARDGAHPQCAGHYGLAIVREGVKYRDGGHSRSLSQRQPNTNTIMNELDHKNLGEFFKAIEPNLAAYNHASFGYLALKKGDSFELTDGRLLLQVMRTPMPSGFFQSENVRAGIFRLSELKLTPK